MTFWLFLSLFSIAQCQQWMLFGGYKGFEGEEGTSVLNEMELLTLTKADKFNEESSWCQKSFSSSGNSFDGSTVDMINTFAYVGGLADQSQFSSAHNSLIFDRVLACGGADMQYKITNTCR